MSHVSFKMGTSFVTVILPLVMSKKKKKKKIQRNPEDEVEWIIINYYQLFKRKPSFKSEKLSDILL